jgi:hypothetical protein
MEIPLKALYCKWIALLDQYYTGPSTFISFPFTSEADDKIASRTSLILQFLR